MLPASMRELSARLCLMLSCCALQGAGSQREAGVRAMVPCRQSAACCALPHFFYVLLSGDHESAYMLKQSCDFVLTVGCLDLACARHASLLRSACFWQPRRRTPADAVIASGKCGRQFWDVTAVLLAWSVKCRWPTTWGVNVDQRCIPLLPQMSQGPLQISPWTAAQCMGQMTEQQVRHLPSHAIW
jgi:hypothetical protein